MDTPLLLTGDVLKNPNVLPEWLFTSTFILIFELPLKLALPDTSPFNVRVLEFVHLSAVVALFTVPLPKLVLIERFCDPLKDPDPFTAPVSSIVR